MTLSIGDLLEVITRDIDEAARRIHKEPDMLSDIGEVEITVNLEVEPDDEAVDAETGTVIDADRLRDTGFRFSRIGVSRRQPVDLPSKASSDADDSVREDTKKAMEELEERISKLPKTTRDVVRPLIDLQNKVVNAEIVSMRNQLTTLSRQLAAKDEPTPSQGTNLAIRVVVIPQIDA